MSDSDLPPLRRVVASHNAEGVASITSDGEITIKHTRPSGGQMNSIWKIMDGSPTNDNNSLEDGAERMFTENFGVAPTKGNAFHSVEMGPGMTVAMHRTSSIDYMILIQGEIVFILEDGTETHLKNAGDIVIDKGVMHGWRNPSATKWCRMLGVCMGAEPAVAAGKTMEPSWSN